MAKGSSSAARLSTNGVKLTQQLASEAQMSDPGRIIIEENLRSGPRLAKMYGGKVSDWVKKQVLHSVRTVKHLKHTGMKISLLVKELNLKQN